jgi:hypothetical protein
MNFKKALLAVPTLLLLMGASEPGCEVQPTSDQKQQAQQERLLQEGTSQTGMPAIKNFRERKLLKDILELRDQDGLATYTYVWSEMQGKMIFFCNSFGYGIPYATQYTNPQKIADHNQGGYAILAQADPNGLFSPAAAEGTWVMCKNPKGGDVRPVYIEPRVIVAPFPLQ